MTELVVRSQKEKELLDITMKVQGIVAESGIQTGVCHLFLLHTSAALTTADLDNGTDLDMLDAFEHIVPQLNYRHLHSPRHVKYHILSSIIGASLCVPFEDTELVLGTWQKIVLVELGGPRERSIQVTVQ